ASTNLFKLDPLRLVAVPPGDFFKILKQASESDVVVSFLGPPNLSDDQIAGLGTARPRVIAVCTGDLPKQVNLPRLFGQKLLQAVVVTGGSVPLTPPASKRPQDWFDYLFTIVTSANLSELPGANPAPR